MKRPLPERLFTPLIFWTIVTGIFAWLPLVRILGRPEGYTWGILGFRGAGMEGPFWIFSALTVFVLAMLYTAFRGPRSVARPMIVLWHLAAAGVVVTSVVQGGRGATFQGQGLGFDIPMWLLVVPFGGFLVLAGIWAVLDHRIGGSAPARGWAGGNVARLAGSLGLFVAALFLFRAGNNYDAITVVAILATIGHWMLLVDSIAVAPAR